MTSARFWAEIDDEGRLTLPDGAAARLEPGAKVLLERRENGWRVSRPGSELAKVYVEPTNRCNLDCRTCIRQNWDATFGKMSAATFRRILDGVAAADPLPTVFFGGLGEPLFHPNTVAMVAQAKAVGARVELITNGTLLTAERARGLIGAGLDVLWVSLDGATPESYADVRLGAELPQVLANLKAFVRARPPSHHPRPELGIAFVAMKRNIGDLPQLLALARRLKASRFLVSNVLPHTPEMAGETLYGNTLHNIAYLPSPWLPALSLPKMDLSPETEAPFLQAMRSGRTVTFAGHTLGANSDRCQFIDEGSVSIGWDGHVSPCTPLLYSHTSYLHGRERHVRGYSVGNVNEQALPELWRDPEHVAFRHRVQKFDFSPCSFCGGCENSQGNEIDCGGNTFPTCGGCLWAQGVIRCP